MKAVDHARHTAVSHLDQGLPPHGLSSNTMALITADCDAMRSLAHPNDRNHLGLCVIQYTIAQRGGPVLFG